MQVSVKFHYIPLFPTSYETYFEFQFLLGWFANPIYGSGDYPQIMKDKILNKSIAQGYNRCRLPEFTQDEIDYIRGWCDFPLIM